MAQTLFSKSFMEFYIENLILLHWLTWRLGRRSRLWNSVILGKSSESCCRELRSKDLDMEMLLVLMLTGDWMRATDFLLTRCLQYKWTHIQSFQRNLSFCDSIMFQEMFSLRNKWFSWFWCSTLANWFLTLGNSIHPACIF